MPSFRSFRVRLFIAIALPVTLLNLSAMPMQAEAATAKSKAVSPSELPPLDAGGKRVIPPPTATEKPIAAASETRKGIFDKKSSRIESQSATENVYRNADGTYTAELFAGVANFKDKSGKWSSVDSRLSKRPNGKIGNGSAPVDVALADGPTAGQPVVTATDPSGKSVGFSLRGAKTDVTPIVKDSTARYIDVAPNLDLEYQVGASSLKENVKVKGISGIANEYSFDLKTDLLPSVGSEGSIDLKSGDDVVFTLPQGEAVDAVGAISPVKVKLGGSVGAWTVDVVPDNDWMRSAERRFPIDVDPITTFSSLSGTGVDTYTSSANPGASYDGASQAESGSYVNRIGYSTYSSNEHYSYLKFDTSAISGKTISSSQFLFDTLSMSSSTATFNVYPISQSWSPGAVSWFNPVNHYAVSKSVAPTTSSSTSVDLTDWTTQWANGSMANNGISADTAGINAYIRMYASESTAPPRLVVTWGSAAPAPPMVSPNDNANIRRDGVTFNATPVVDPDGDPVKYQFCASQSDPWSDPLAKCSPLSFSTSWSPGPNQFTEGQNWIWSVLSYDGWTATKSPNRQFQLGIIGIPKEPMADTTGPVIVNTVQGNAVIQLAGPKFKTLGAELGVSFAYNSLQTTSVGGLPIGWRVNGTSTPGMAYDKVASFGNALSITDPTGRTQTWRKNGTDANAGWNSPNDDKSTLAASHDSSGNLSGFNLTATDGRTYQFDSNGGLTKAFTSTDNLSPAGPEYSYVAGNLTEIKDPVTSRVITLSYGTGCATPPTGFSAAPSGALCKIAYWDGSQTDVFYVGTGANAKLSRVVDPGESTTDFGYDSGGRLTFMRSPKENDWVAKDSPNRNSIDYGTKIAYDTNGLVTGVTLSAPTLGGVAESPSKTYSYPSFTETRVKVAGITADPARIVTYNDLGQLLTDTDSTGARTDYTYDDHNNAESATKVATDRKSTMFYDAGDRLTETYGPAPASCFDANRLPTTCAVPVAHSISEYDSNLSGGSKGLAASYWDNAYQSGNVKVRRFENTNSGNPTFDWSVAQPAGLPVLSSWSAQFTGRIDMPNTNPSGYLFSAAVDDGARIYIDDQLAYSSWPSESVVQNAIKGEVNHSSRRIRVDYQNTYAGGVLTLNWQPPGGSVAMIPGASLTPDYGLVTRSQTDDSTTGSPTAVTNTSYFNPAYGLIGSVSQDPAGANLVTSKAYIPNDQWYRPQSKTMPAQQPSGPSTTFAYYSPSETVTNPCTGLTSPIQAGMLKTSTDPTAADASTKVTHSVYDIRGRVVCSWINSESATTTAYDARGRVAFQIVPANGTAPARTVTYDYVVGRDPLKESVADGTTAQPITTAYDLLGRVVTYTDARSQVTNYSYNRVGQVVNSNMPGTSDARAYTYDGSGRVDTQSIGPSLASLQTAADADYDLTTKEMNKVDFPASGAGNGTSMSIVKDFAGRDKTYTYSGATISGIAFRGQSTANSGASTATSLSINKPAGTQTNDVLLAHIAVGAGSSSTVATPSGWTLIGTDNQGDNVRSAQFWKLAAATEPASYTFTLSTGKQVAGTIVAYSGVDTTAPVTTGFGTTSSGTTTSHEVLGITTPAANSLAVAFVAGRGCVTFTPASGWATRTQNCASGANAESYISEKSVAMASATGDVYPTSATGIWDATQMIALKPSGSGGGSTAIASDSVTYSQSGRIVDESIDGVDAYTSGNNFTYDSVGRLTQARVSGHNYVYGFGTTGCNDPGVNNSAYKNTNRSYLTDNGSIVADYCYDNADRLWWTNDARYAGIPVYDAHGNTTTLSGTTMAYDMANRHVSTTTTATGVTVSYKRDALDRILERTVTTPSTGIALRGQATANSGTSTASSVVVNKPAGTATNDIMLAHVAVGAGSSATVSAPAGWTLIGTDNQGDNVRSAQYWKFATASEPTSYTFTLSSAKRVAGTIVSYSGVSTTSPVVSGFGTTSSGTTTSHEVLGVTTPAANSLAVAFVAARGCVTFTPASGWTTRTQNCASGSTAESYISEKSVATASAMGTVYPTSASGVWDATQMIALRPSGSGSGSTSTTTAYVYSNKSDNPSAVFDGSSTVVDKTIGLIGGASRSVRVSSGVETPTWNYPNIHGDVMAQASQSGIKTGTTAIYEPFGQLVSSTLPENSTGNFDYGWLGGAQRATEHEGSLSTVEMGARQYVTGLGRFLSVDPVEGGSANDYDYANADPINSVDLDGSVVALAAAAPVAVACPECLAAAAVAGVIIYGGFLLAKQAKKSGKEKADDIPSWVNKDNARQKPGESPDGAADRVMKERFPEGDYDKGPTSEYNKIKKWISRNP